ncbi:MAG: SRPBCC family protein [Dehalococcoidia bacterium]
MDVTNEALLAAPLERVFAYVTTARNWPDWHPATEGVSGAIDEPMRIGDRIVERARIGGVLAEGAWTVVEHEPGRCVVLTMPGTRLGDLTIRYDFVPEGSGVRFCRTLRFDLAGLPEGMPAAEIERQLAEDSAIAVARIAAILEA